MRKKNQTNSPRLMLFGGILCLTIITGLAVLFMLDKSMIARTQSQRDSSATTSANTRQSLNVGGATVFKLSPSESSALGKVLDISDLGKGNINPTQAREALRSASGKTIQNAVQMKTGKSVGLDKIEKARTAALSAEGQRKINKALQRRDEVDIAKIRDKLKL